LIRYEEQQLFKIKNLYGGGGWWRGIDKGWCFLFEKRVSCCPRGVGLVGSWWRFKKKQRCPL